MITLKPRISSDAYQAFYSETTPTDPRAYFLREFADVSGQSFETLSPGFVEIKQPVLVDESVPYNREIIDTYSDPLADTSFFGKIKELLLPMTTKDSNVFEQPRPLLVRDDSLEARYAALGQPIDANANALNSPAAMSLSTMIFGNPLTANYAQSGAIASGTDNAPAVMNMWQGVSPNAVLEDPLPGESVIPGIKQLNSVANCWEDPNCKGQIMLFIVGALILGIGIFALTR